MAFLPRTVVTAVTCGLLLFLSAPAALAHDGLKASSPSKNAKVKALEEIELEFTARIRMPFVVLHDAKGKAVELAKPVADGKIVTAKVPTPPAPGKYVIGWRVVSSDGHPIVGEIPFTFTPPPPPAETPTPEASTGGASTPEASTPEASAPQTPATSEAVQTPETTEAASEQPSQGLPGWVWLVLAALVVLGIGTFVVTRRRGTPE
ncbi:copper resistance CopC family protein [Nonomuraea typhae]|uniref:copper resistance CopC family protein n=1 Tax=Nonomuraea typhae TaxID=2603600 RepID=UPI0012F8AD97|nr:copper resistance protein CopC [Nonomuraea typhae]